MSTPSKEEQVAEANRNREARGEPPVPPKPAQGHVDIVETDPTFEDRDIDTGAPVVETAAPQEKEPEKPKGPIRMAPSDGVRARMSERFKRRRAEGEDAGEDFDGDTNKESLVVGKAFAQPEAPVETPGQAVEGEPANPQPAPRTFKVKIRGQEREVTQDELIAAAQKGLAGDDYLAEARQILERAEATTRAARPSDAQHPERNAQPAPKVTEQTRTEETTDDEPQHPEGERDPLEDLVETIQFEADPKKAAAKLRSTIAEEAGKVVEQRVERKFEDHALRDRMATDLDVSQKALSNIMAENDDIKDDPMAFAAIRDTIERSYRDDLVKLGVPEDKIPRNSAELTEWHRWYRTDPRYMGRIRSFETVTRSAIKQFRDWSGRPSTGGKRTEPGLRGTPRVQVDRTERREALAPQPTRTTPAPSQNKPAANEANARADRLRGIRMGRGQRV